MNPASDELTDKGAEIRTLGWFLKGQKSGQRIAIWFDNPPINLQFEAAEAAAGTQDVGGHDYDALLRTEEIADFLLNSR